VLAAKLATKRGKKDPEAAGGCQTNTREDSHHLIHGPETSETKRE
jgi:hypothetical protein